MGVQVLGSLLAEDDGVVDTWVLRGCAFEGLALPDANNTSNEEKSKEKSAKDNHNDDDNDGSQKKNLLKAAHYHWEVALQTLESTIEELAALVSSRSDDMNDCENKEEVKAITLQREKLMA